MSLNIQTSTGLLEIGGSVTKEKIVSALGYSPADENDLIDNIVDDESGELLITDDSNNAIMKVDASGITTTGISATNIATEAIQLNNIENKDGELLIADSSGNAVVKVDASGITTTGVVAKSVAINDVDVGAKLDILDANISSVSSHTTNTSVHVTASEKNTWNSKATTTYVDDKVSSKANQSDLTSHTSDTTAHVTATERSQWNAKSTFSGDYNDLRNAPDIKEDGSGDLVIADPNGNIIFRSDGNGFETTNLSAKSLVVNSVDIATTVSQHEEKLNGIANGANKVTISTGSTNGTISVSTNGTSANVAVKGLGSAAYTASAAYDAAGTAQTKANAALASAKAYADSLIDGLTAEGDANAGVVQAALNAHKEDKSNPHGVTYSQVGAAAASHNHAATDINSGTLSSDRLPTVPVAKGGTGSTNGATGLKNLFAAGKTVLSSHQYGATFPTGVSDGTIFFKESSGGIDEVSDSLVRDLMLKAYPVGSLYVSRNAASPASLFGGTWTQIKDTFLLAAGDTYSIGSTGGSATVTLTEAQMPSHYHRAWIKDFLGQTYDKTSSAYTAVLNNSSIQYNYATGLSNSETVALTEARGGNEAHSNMPPYLAVYVWERTA